MQPQDKSIRERAYEIWESEGRPEGREAQHWEQARSELPADDLAQSVLSSAPLIGSKQQAADLADPPPDGKAEKAKAPKKRSARKTGVAPDKA
ncbi:DUF2934 domain-containing protein [Hoeflea ulvae]|uniref:DUF2934 domain-containing protein n=1 Tax=Hoeflea ulvae TaxID=2983764 RepID=A0ABT3YLZ8_9HYPH|nr:DUF2934 domain-containing protein [Hoeflea ulvae]MCY0096931.1 DUF2934 domain-containing protein [Hoeflea ulvae]